MQSFHEPAACENADHLSRVQTIGDAISVILMVVAALQLLGMTLPDWAALYSDVPSRQLKASSLLPESCPSYMLDFMAPFCTEGCACEE